MKKRFIAILLCVLMTAALTVTAFAAPADVSEGAWYYDSVMYCIDNNIMVGVSDTEFNPSGTVTRGQFVTALYRIAKSEGNGFTGDWMYPLPFADVDEIPAYAYEAIAWFNQNEIVVGDENGRFGAGDFITREQMAAILYRYVKFCGDGFEGDWMFLLPCNDRDEISDWAFEAVCWCYMNNILKGKDDGNFDPDGNAKRSEVAAILQRFCEGAEEEPVEEPIEEPVVVTGAWKVNTEFGEAAIPEEAKAAFDGAMEGFTGVGYTPVAFLGSQVVAGVNYAFLCKAAPVVPDAEASLAVVTIFRDLEGQAVVADVKPVSIADYIDAEAGEQFNGLPGGWSAAEACGAGLDGSAKEAFEKATAELLGVNYVPLACLGTQLVAGTNYAVLCKSTVVAPDAAAKLAIMVIYADLEGGAEIISIK